MDFKNSHSRGNNIALWSWNEKLNIENTLLNLDKILKSGFNGFCIKSQSGLSNRFLGDGWMRNVDAVINKAAESNARVWIFDENGGFSGTANGTINSENLLFQQKFLRFESGEKTNDRSIISKDGYHFYYDVNPYYVDVFDKNVSCEFIKKAYAPYAEKFPEKIETLVCSLMLFFTKNIPWSFSFPAEYKKAYGEELLDVLQELFRPVGNFKDTRAKFWNLVSLLFAQNFVKPIFDFCSENNISLALNFSEEHLESNPLFLGFASAYEYSHMPTIQLYSRNDSAPFFPIYAASVCEQLEKKGSNAIILLNSGYGTTLDDYKRIAQQQLVRGINHIVSPCEASSLYGDTKYDNSNISLFHFTDNEEYQKLTNYLSSIENIFSEGDADFDTLLIRSISDDFIKDNSAENTLYNSIKILEEKHIPFHIGDELILKKYAYVENDTLVVWKRRYKTIVLTTDCILSDSTTKLLTQFESNGGFIVMADSLPDNEICDNKNLLYTYRKFSDYKIHYFVNNSSEEFVASISNADKMLDINSGDVIPFYGIYKFSPFEGIILIDDGSSQQARPFKKPLKTLDISGCWELCDSTDNVLVLDKCDVSFDGSIFYENENCADVIEKAITLERNCDIECTFKFNITKIPDMLYLACENTDSFSILINDILLDEPRNGFFFNQAFVKTDISKYVRTGENIITVKSFFSPSNDFLISYKKALESSSELNRLNFPLKIFPLYITGNFGILCDGEFRKLDKNAYRYIGNFSIDSKKETYELSNLEKQGFPFFSGEMVFSKTFNLSDTSYCLKFKPKGIYSVKIQVNDKKAETLIWEPYECDISELLKKGDNTITLTITNSPRNLFGPHHIPMGELYKVSAGDFYKNPSVRNYNKPTPWENNYCFIEFGLE